MACFAGRLPQRPRDALQCVTRQGIMPEGTCLRHASRPLPAPVCATTAINSPSFQAKGYEEFSRRDGLQKKLQEMHISRFCRTFCSGGRAEAVAPVGGRDEAARAAPRAVAVRPALPSASPSGRVWSRCRRSRPPRVHDAAANAVHPRRGRGRRGPPLGACATRGWREGTGRRAIAGPGAACARVLAASWAALPALGSGSGTPGRPSACGSHRWAACSARSAVRRTAMV